MSARHYHLGEIWNLAYYERLGLALAAVALWITGNRIWAKAVSDVPLIHSQQLLIIANPNDPSQSDNLHERGWLAWSPDRR